MISMNNIKSIIQFIESLESRGIKLIIVNDDISYILPNNIYLKTSDKKILKAKKYEIIKILEEKKEKVQEYVPKINTSYESYIEWVQKQDKSEALDFWKEQLNGVTGPTKLCFNNTNISIHKSIKVKEKEYFWSEEFTKRCVSFVKENFITLGALAELAWGIVLSRYSNQNDLILGTIVSRRPTDLPQIEKVIGLFINPVPIRLQIDKNQSALNHLKEIHRKIQLSNQYSYLSLNEIQMQTHIPKDLQLFYSLFIFENYPIEEALEDWSDVGFDIKNFYTHEKTNYPVTIYMCPGKKLKIKVSYDLDCFDIKTIDQVVNHIKNVMQWIITNPEEKIFNVSLLDSEEEQRLRYCGKGKAFSIQQKTFNQIFEEQVKKTPQNIAVQCNDEKINYEALNKRANRFARFLLDQKQLNTKKEQIAAIYLNRSVQMIECILALWKIKMAYVLIDPSFPETRAGDMFKLVEPSFVITNSAFYSNLAKINIKQVVKLDDISEQLNFISYENLSDISYSSKNLAYVFFTSGSTGKLKGALLEHLGAVNHVYSKLHDIKADKNSIVAQTANQNFNIFNWQTFGALTLGGKIIIFQDELLMNPQEFVNKVIKNKVSILQIIPSFLPIIIEFLKLKENKCVELKHLKMLLVTGEQANSATINKWADLYPKIPILNSYGCAEVSDDSIHHIIKDKVVENQKVIGKPIFNTIVYIAKQTSGNNWALCSTGELGEILLGGIGVGRGYINNKNETEERYITDPFGQCKKIFRTGDLGRWTVDGNIECIGRANYQKKIHGRDIELTEIETALARHPKIGQCVAAINEYNDKKILIVYYVPNTGANKDEISTLLLKKFLSKYLPAYMIPALFIQLEKIPLLPSGKINRNLLPIENLDKIIYEEDYISPKNNVEKILSEIWKDLLKVDRVGIRDNFFSLGGDSIISIQVMSCAREMGIKITPRQLFENPMIEELAKVAVENAKEAIEIDQGLVEGEAPLTPIQRWFFKQELKSPSHFNQAYLFKLKEEIPKETLTDIFTKLIKHHDTLRLRHEYDKKKKCWDQVYSNERVSFLATVGEIDLSKYDENEIEKVIEKNNTIAQASLDIEKGPVIKSLLYKKHTDGSVLLFVVIHHLVIDGISWRILLEDFERLYNQLKKGKELKLLHKTNSYKNWGEKLIEYATSEEIEREWGHWQKVGEGASVFPIDHELKEHMLEGKISYYSVSLSKQETQNLINRVSDAYKTQINDILLSALVLSCYEWSKQEDLLIHLEGHGREDCIKGVDISRTLGWFTGLFPVHLNISKKDGLGEYEHLSEVIKNVKEQLRKIPNKGIGYGILRYLSKDKRVKTLEQNDTARISFNYLGQMEAGLSKDSIFNYSKKAKGQYIANDNIFGVFIDITGIVDNDCLTLNFDFSLNQYNKKSIETLAEGLKKQLRALISHCLASSS